MNYEQWKRELIAHYKESIEWATKNILMQVEQWHYWRGKAIETEDSEWANTCLKWAAQCLDQIEWLQDQKESYEKSYKKHMEDGE